MMSAFQTGLAGPEICRPGNTCLHIPSTACCLQAQGGSRALNEGCLLVLEDRTPIGCIEEVFGPGGY